MPQPHPRLVQEHGILALLPDGLYDRLISVGFADGDICRLLTTELTDDYETSAADYLLVGNVPAAESLVEAYLCASYPS